VVFKSNFGVYTLMEQTGLTAIEILDISEGGMQFQTRKKLAATKRGRRDSDSLLLRKDHFSPSM